MEALKTYDKTNSRVIGTNDLHNPYVLRGQHATHYLVQYGYIEELSGTFDKLYPVLYNYKHNYTDTEFIKTAIERKEFSFSHASVVEHMHCLFGLNNLDDAYRKSFGTMEEDKPVYESRMKNYFEQIGSKSTYVL
jgi:hypothetical protein